MGTALMNEFARASALPAERALPARKRSGGGRRLFRQVTGVVIALLGWEALSASGVVNSFALASPVQTASKVVSQAGPLAHAVLGTLVAWALGLAIAAVLGIVLGTLVGVSKSADAATEWLVRAMRPMPSLALIPIAILVAGLGLKMTAGLVAFASFWPIFINTRYGVRQIDNRLLETAQSLGLRGLSRLGRVVLPAASPMISTGLQVALSLALVVAVSVELVGGTGGLGQFVATAQQGNQTASMYAGIVLGGVLGWALATLYAAVVKRALPWVARPQGEPA